MSAWPPIEYEDGYPADEDFTEHTKLPYDFEHDAQWLLAELPRATEYMPCHCEVRDGVSITGQPCKHIHFSTCGWSGAESIIAFINSRYDLKRLMLQWRRGGHYIFEIPGEQG